LLGSNSGARDHPWAIAREFVRDIDASPVIIATLFRKRVVVPQDLGNTDVSSIPSALALTTRQSLCVAVCIDTRQISRIGTVAT
jgi:hypothetical protein